MADYVLIRDNGSEGHGPPLMTMGEDDAKEFLLGLHHSHDYSLCIYRVPNLYEQRKAGPIAAARVTLADLYPAASAMPSSPATDAGSSGTTNDDRFYHMNKHQLPLNTENIR